MRRVTKARGHVKYHNFVGGEYVQADSVDYNVVDETGRYLNISGTSPANMKRGREFSLRPTRSTSRANGRSGRRTATFFMTDS